MKNVFIAVVIVGMLACLTDAWGGATSITTIQTDEITVGNSDVVEFRLPTTTSRMVKLYGDMVDDSSGTMDIDILDNYATGGVEGNTVYTVDGVGPIVIDDTPAYLTSVATSGTYGYVKVSIGATAIGTRKANITLIMESMSSNPITAP